MDKISEIEKIIGYSFKDKDLLATAFTHSSYAYQYKTKSNENLEFLGDSILNFIVAELLYLSSIGDEGQMTEVRAAVVSRDPLAAVIRKSGLKAYIRYGTGCESQYHSVKFDSNLFACIPEVEICNRICLRSLCFFLNYYTQNASHYPCRRQCKSHPK